MVFVIKLGIDFVTRIAGAKPRFVIWVFGQRITALNHETFNDAMKRRAIIKSFSREGFKIFNRLGRDVRPKLDNHFTFGGFYDGHFIA